jgi:hypothetical protein
MIPQAADSCWTPSCVVAFILESMFLTILPKIKPLFSNPLGVNGTQCNAQPPGSSSQLGTRLTAAGFYCGRAYKRAWW